MKYFIRRLLRKARRRTSTTENALTIKMLQRLMEHAASDELTFLEIGANDGRDTQRFLAAFRSVTIHAFEPEPRAVSEFRARISDDRAVLHEIALGARDGTTTFFRSGGEPPGRSDKYPDGWHKSGSIRRPTGHLGQHPWCTFDEVVEVPLLRLDAWSRANNVGTVDFIWMDVQGAEGDVIAGGADTLMRTRYLYTEYSNVEQYEGQMLLDGILAALPGWQVIERFPNDVLLRNMQFEAT